MSDGAPPLSHPVRRDHVPSGGSAVVLEADGAARAALARHLDISAVAALRAELAVRPWRGDGLTVEGRLTAEVVQTCVVTLEPVTNAIDTTIADYYAPDPEAAARAEPSAPDADDIEPLIGGRVDLGALVVEHLSLALDPYPRRPGVAFQDIEADTDRQDAESPFARLGALRGSRKP